MLRRRRPTRSQLTGVIHQVVILRILIRAVIQDLESALVKASVSSLLHLRRVRAKAPREQSSPQPRKQQEEKK